MLLRHFLILPLLCVLTISGSACSDSSAESADSGEQASGMDMAPDESATQRSDQGLPVVAQEAREGDLVLRVESKGEVYGEGIVKISSEVGGTVSELLVRPGSFVAKGQPMVRFEPYVFDLAVREAQAALDQAEQSLRELWVPDSIAFGVRPDAERMKMLGIRAGVPAAALRLEKAKWERERAVVLSPVSGQVDRLELTLGERVGAGAPIATVVDPSELRVEALVMEHNLSLVRRGGEAMITSAAIPGRTLRGRIDAVLPLVDSVSRFGRVIVRFSQQTALRPGMFANVQLEAERIPDRIMVPSKAVIERDGRPLVFVVREGRGQWTYIQPGRSNGMDTEVLPDSSTGQIPINPGDQIIVDGHLTLIHDAAVKIVAVKDMGDVVPQRSSSSVPPENN